MNADTFPHGDHAPAPGAGRLLCLAAIVTLMALATAGLATPSLARVTDDVPAPVDEPRSPADQGDLSPVQVATPALPLRFIANAGQTDPGVHFTVKGAGHTIFFTDQEVVLHAVRTLDGTARRSLVRLSFPGANEHPAIEGRLPLPGGVNFFIGDDAARWYANVPTYAAVIYRDLYPGVDLAYSGAEGQLKSEFRLAAGIDPHLIRLAYLGVEAARLLPDGSLGLQTSLGELIETAPLVYQEVEGVRREVAGRYVLLNRQVSEGIATLGFEIGHYDPALPLTIDPTLTYSSYLGGSGDEDSRYPGVFDHAAGIATDGSGNVYIAGQTNSIDFPTSGDAIQDDVGGMSDAYVTQLVNAGGVYTYGYSTYLGGSETDYANGIAVTADGNASIVGVTGSPDFPVFNAPQPTHHGGAYDAFVTQIISQSGVYTFAYSTFFGGSGVDYGQGVALDSGDNAFIVGETTSTNLFTTTTAIQPACAGASCQRDAFMTQIINASGTYTFGYSSYLGGSGIDRGLAIALDTSDNVFVTGETSSVDFPTVNAPEPVLGAVRSGQMLNTKEGVDAEAFASPDAFVTEVVNSGGTYTYQYSTYLGGSFPDVGRGIAVDDGGNAIVTGNTASHDFPILNAVQPTYGGGSSTGEEGGDAFVTQIVDDGSVYTYTYSTYLGGRLDDIGQGISVDGSGNPVVAGETRSDDFPTYRSFIGSLHGTADAFLAHLISQNLPLTYSLSTYLGGSGADSGRALDMQDTGGVCVTGQTQSEDFPTENALDDTLSGTSDAFVACIGWGGLMISKTASRPVVSPEGSLTFTLVYTNDNPTVASSVVISDYLPIPITYSVASYTSSGPTITPTGSFSYTWEVDDLAPGASGAIAILATLSNSVGLTLGTVITNTAEISAVGVYSNAAYLTSSVTFTIGSGLYMPVIERN